MNSPLSDLEAVAIGEILTHQPCTAHFVRKCFSDSPTKHFSDSAGSVYPMMKRLEQNGFLESRQQKEKQRTVRLYTCSASGKQALKLWLVGELPEAALLTADPLRTRILFLHRLPRSRRRKWLESIEQALQDKLASVEKFAKQLDDQDSDEGFCQKLAHDNALIDLKSRITWLRSTKTKLEKRKLI